MAFIGKGGGCAALVTIVLTGSHANATNQGITGKKLLLKSPSKFVLLSKDAGISIAGSDPVGGADSSLTFDDGSGPVTMTLPKGIWRTNGSHTLFKYKNAAAPGGPSVVKIAKVKPGLLKVVGKGLPFAVPNGEACGATGDAPCDAGLVCEPVTSAPATCYPPGTGAIGEICGQ